VLLRFLLKAASYRRAQHRAIADVHTIQGRSRPIPVQDVFLDRLVHPWRRVFLGDIMMPLVVGSWSVHSTGTHAATHAGRAAALAPTLALAQPATSAALADEAGKILHFLRVGAVRLLRMLVCTTTTTARTTGRSDPAQRSSDRTTGGDEGATAA